MPFTLDRAYLDFFRLHAFTESLASFVIRGKSNLDYRRRGFGWSPAWTREWKSLNPPSTGGISSAGTQPEDRQPPGVRNGPTEAKNGCRVDRWRNSNQKQRWLASALQGMESKLRRIRGYRHLLTLRDARQREIRRQSAAPGDQVA